MTHPRVPEASSHLRELISRYVIAKNLLEMQLESIKPFREDADRAEAALFDAIEAQGLKSVRDKELGLFTLSDLADPKVLDVEAFVAWAENAMPELLIPNRARLGKIVRDILKGDRPAIEGTPEGLPPGVDKTFRRSISWRRG